MPYGYSGGYGRGKILLIPGKSTPLDWRYGREKSAFVWAGRKKPEGFSGKPGKTGRKYQRGVWTDWTGLSARRVLPYGNCLWWWRTSAQNSSSGRYSYRLWFKRGYLFPFRKQRCGFSRAWPAKDCRKMSRSNPGQVWPGRPDCADFGTGRKRSLPYPYFCTKR